MDLKCFDAISVGEPRVSPTRITAVYAIEFENRKLEFELRNKYDEDISSELLEEFARVMVTLPAVNYGLFSDEIYFDFELNEKDLELFKVMMEATARDIFVNRILKRTGFVKEEFIPKEDDVRPEDAMPRARVSARGMTRGKSLVEGLDFRKSAVMSSGGKDSLLTYCVLKEVGQDVYPCFFNESGGHWRTALTAYRYLSSREKNTMRVWSNVDRLYSLFDRSMRILEAKKLGRKSDIYPIRLFFFEHYVFSFLPLLYKHRIGNVNLGNEFDDPLCRESEYLGIRHYCAVYDQSQEFDDYMTSWFRERGFGFRQWSAVRPLSGLLEERILANRYPEFLRLQRSCHSVIVRDGKLVPCGRCKKCLGILTFLLANGIDPKLLGYGAKSVDEYETMVSKSALNLDRDELEHAIYLARGASRIRLNSGRPHEHVETLHFHRSCSRPDAVPRELWSIYDIFEKYSKGYSTIKDGAWRIVPKEEALSI
jgi:7-cyano-7-deazaguanine synthase in queuosine biosynthesis